MFSVYVLFLHIFFVFTQFFQCFVVMGAAMSQMGHGAAYGYTAVLVAHYTDDQGNKMSNDDLSWIGK